MSVANDKSNYRKRKALGLKNQGKAATKALDAIDRAAIVRALAAAGPRAYMNLRALTKK
jgi:hypothetical protein